MEEKTYYVYYLIDPRNDKIFYVGKGKGKRMYFHEQQVRKGCKPYNMNKRLYYKIKSIHKNHYKVKYQKIFFTDDENEAYLIEEQHQRKYGLENLCNAMYGTPHNGVIKGSHSIRKGKTYEEIFGYEKAIKINNKKVATRRRNNNYQHSEETKRKIGNHFRGKTFEERFGKERADRIKTKQSKSLKGNLACGWSKGLTKETDKRLFKMSESRKGQFTGISFEDRFGIKKAKDIGEKIRQSKVGLHHSEKTKRKISESKRGISWEEQYGKKRADEMKKNNSNKSKGKNNSFYGKKHSEESRKKMTDSHKGQAAWNKGIPSSRKGKTLEKLYGPEKAAEINKKKSQNTKNTKHWNKMERLNLF